jgi:hypothetical protein
MGRKDATVSFLYIQDLGEFVEVIQVYRSRLSNSVVIEGIHPLQRPCIGFITSFTSLVFASVVL